MMISTFVLMTFFSTKYNKTSIYDFILFMLPILILLLSTAFLIHDFSRILPYLIFIPVCIFLSFWYTKTRNKLIILLLFLVSFLVGYYIVVTTFTYVANKDSEKNIPFPDVTLLNSRGEKIELPKDKIVVLDFWSTSCGICFEKFPELQETFLKYRHNANIQIYAVNFPLKKDKFEKTKNMLDDRVYTFPKIYAKSADEIQNKLHFNTFPHLIIIKNGRIRYDGMFETQNRSLVFSIESEIDRLINE